MWMLANSSLVPVIRFLLTLPSCRLPSGTVASFTRAKCVQNSRMGDRHRYLNCEKPQRQDQRSAKFHQVRISKSWASPLGFTLKTKWWFLPLWCCLSLRIKWLPSISCHINIEPYLESFTGRLINTITLLDISSVAGKLPFSTQLTWDVSSVTGIFNYIIISASALLFQRGETSPFYIYTPACAHVSD